MNYFCLLFSILCCLPTAIWTAPAKGEDYCQGSGLYNYDQSKEYRYDYAAKTKLWINDVSEDAESNIYLNATVSIQRVEPCRYQLKLSDVRVYGASVSDSNGVAAELQKNVAVFSVASNGALVPLVKFNGFESKWSRNIKRGIISAFQLRAESDLKSADPLNDKSSEPKSSVVYETDLFGKCRTTYKLRNSGAGKVEIVKKKALHRCSLRKHRDSPVQAEEYDNIAEYYNGQAYIENHKCQAKVNGGVLDEVECKHESTMRAGSRGDNGLQSVTQLNLKLKSQNAAGAVAPLDRAAPSSIVHDYEDDVVPQSNFDINGFIASVCSNTNNGVLDKQYAQNFRELIDALKSKSKADLVKLVDSASAKCKFAANAIISGIVFTETDASVEAVLDLMDKDLFKDAVLITEFPLLTAVARDRHPSAELINKFKAYLAGKDAKFAYLQKSYLIYSSIIKTFCSDNDCSADLDNWSSVLSANLGSNCADSKNKDAVVASLKAIGNIGHVKDVSVLEKCAAEKSNSLEVRVAAIQSLRRFSCSRIENLDGNYKILQDSNDDAEVRIVAFRSLVKCLNSNKFQTFASKSFGEFLQKEEDYQVVSYVIDFAKERGVTCLLNPILSNPEIKDKLQLNFKEFSWNNYKFRYSVVRDAAIEVDTSVIYTSKTFIPRNINFNITLHGYGLRINALDVQIRLEGLDEVLKAILVDKLTSEQLVKRLSEDPEQLIDILKALADKLKYAGEKPYASIAVRLYGSEVFFSQLDQPQELQRVGGLFRNFKAVLYKERSLLRSLQIFSIHSKKPLISGFEFGGEIDVNFGLFHNRNGNRQEKGSRTEFNLKVQNGASLFVRRQYNVEINSQNKLSLRKDTTGNLRLKLDYDGFRQDGVAQYNVNIAPEEVVELFALEGKYYKLGAKSQYVDVKEFKIPQITKNLCTSENFHDHVGLDVCFSIQRPSFRGLREIVRSLRDRDNDMDVYEDSDDFDFDAEDDDDDDASDDDDIERPMISLAGPFKYVFAIRNSDLINKFVFDGKVSRNETHRSFAGSLQTSSINKRAPRRLDFNYARHKCVTARTYHRGISVELKVPQDNDVRFHFSSQLDYRKKELLDYQLKLSNRILKDVDFELHFNRKHKIEGQKVSNYTLHAVYDSKLFNPQGTYLHLMSEVQGIQKSIKFDFYIENKEVKFVQARLDLEHQDEPQYDTDYLLKLVVENAQGAKLEADGQVAYGLLASNININGVLNLNPYESNPPFNVKFGHAYSAASESHVLIDVVMPRLGLAHGTKVTFEFSQLVRSLKLEFSSPETRATDSPKIFFFNSKKSADENEKHLEFGFKNFEVFLLNPDSRLQGAIKKAIGSDQLNKFSVEFTSHKEGDRKDLTFEVDANDVTINRVHVYYFGSLEAIRANPDEIPEQALGAGFEFAVFDYKGGIKGNGKMAYSKSKKSFKDYLSVIVDGMLKPLLKLSELEVSGELANGKINYKSLLQKEGDVYKSVELSAQDAAARGSSPVEFDVNYVKVLNDGSKKSGKGTVKFTMNDIKNMESSVNIPGLYSAQATIANERKEGFQLHKAKLVVQHLDVAEPVEKSFEFQYQKQSETAELKVEAKSGKPNANQGQNYLISFNNKIVKGQLPGGDKKVMSYNHAIKYKSAQRNFDIDSQSSYAFDLPNRQIVLNSKTNAKFPSLLSQEKAIRFLNRELSVQLGFDKTSAKINYNAETDSQFFGRLLRFVKLSYQHQLGQPKLVDASFNADYRLAPSDENPDPKQKNFKISLGVTPCSQSCFDVQVNIDQQIKEQCPKSSINAKYSRSGEASNLKISTGLNVKCDQLLITDTKLDFSRNPVQQQYIRRDLIGTSNSMLYQPKRIEWSFLPFNKHVGYAKLGLQIDSTKSWVETFEYTRELNDMNKMVSCNYKATMNYGDNFKKSCELKINKKNQYLNEFNCGVNVPSTPKQLNYGYRIFVNNPQELFFGQRHFEISVQLPTGRALRVDYKGNRATPIDNTDDDNDPNDEREFNGTANLYWDYVNDRNKVVVVNLKRDNIAPGQFKFFIEAVNTPLIKVARIEYNTKRAFNETNLNLALSYELKNGKKNRLDTNVKLSSDLVESRFSMEVNLERPKFNVEYSNEYNKQTGKLQHLRIRVAELLKFVVDKEYDPNARRLSLEFFNPQGSKYQLDGTSSYENDVYTVQGILKQGSKSLSTIRSVYDSSNTNLNVKVQAHVTKSQYELNFGLVNESFASGYLKQDNKFAGVASVELEPVPIVGRLHLHDLVLNLRWNRFWHKFQENLLGGIDSPSASPAVNLPAGYKFNSYFGDVYAELINDLKPVVDSIKQRRAELRQDLFKTGLIHLEFYGAVIPQAEEKRQELLQQAAMQNKMAPIPEEPLYIRLFKRYNALADNLNKCFETVYASRFRRFAKYIPKLSRISYNDDDNKSQFDNNIIVRKRTLRAGNLYQFNAEYRNRVRIAGNAILRVKSLLVRNIKGISLRALINKYKYRSVRYDYTIVGSVFNKRNIIGFGGESESLYAKSRYLLAHDASKNRFSVVLNYDDSSKDLLSVYFYGKGPIGINYDKASLDNKPIALPHEIQLANGKSIYIGKIHNGICVHVDYEVRVCCHEESGSCTVALTRWWTGKVNGLFGKTNNFPSKIKLEDWAIDKISARNVQRKPPTDEAAKKCYLLFGRHRKSPFRNSFMAVRPNGWRSVCESALSFDAQKNYCPLLRAYAEHAQLEYVHVDVPAECYKCQNGQKSYKIGESVDAKDASEDQLARGSDYVFISLPCDSKKFSFNKESLLNEFNKDKSQSNNYYAIKIDKDETSIYQAANGQFVNFDVKAAGSVLQRDANGQVFEEAFYEAIHQAEALFSRRVASARYLIIVSCGNCLPYSARKVRKLSKELASRNIIVSSWGNYNINLGADADNEEVPVGYSENNLYLYSKSSKDFVDESLSSFKVDHEGDLCHRLAVRTHGSVFNLNELRKPHVLSKLPGWFKENREHHTFSLKSCELIHNSKYGDFADFKFSKVSHVEDDDDDADDIDLDDDADDVVKRIKIGN